MYYPDQRAITPYTVIYRHAMLPEQAAGRVRVSEGRRVDMRDVVANGVVPARYVILDATQFFKLRKSEALADLLRVEVGDVVEADQVLAGKSPTRGRRLFAPVGGVVTQVEDGQIILQERPHRIDLQAGVRGRVSRVERDRGVVIETVGAHVQGVWGNGRHIISPLRTEPKAGLENITADTLEMRYSGAVLLTRRPLTAAGMRVMRDQGFDGLIAPSMDSSLIDEALQADCAIVLTAGFGSMNMSSMVFNLLGEFEGQQVTLDAHTPQRWETRRPEVIINVVRKDNERPSRPNVMTALRTGMTVRINRDPHMGMTGIVTDLPKTPTLLDNGLRVPCAQVELVAGETVPVPLANLEVLGR